MKRTKLNISIYLPPSSPSHSSASLLVPQQVTGRQRGVSYPQEPPEKNDGGKGSAVPRWCRCLVKNEISCKSSLPPSLHSCWHLYLRGGGRGRWVFFLDAVINARCIDTRGSQLHTTCIKHIFMLVLLASGTRRTLEGLPLPELANS